MICWFEAAVTEVTLLILVEAGATRQQLPPEVVAEEEEGYEEGGPDAEEGYEDVWDEVQEALSTMEHEEFDG